MDLDAPTPTPLGRSDAPDGNILAGLAVLALLGGVLAAYLLLSNGSTEVEVASPSSTTSTVAVEDDGDTTPPVTSAPATPAAAGSDNTTDTDDAEVSLPPIGDEGAGDTAFGGAQSLTVHTSAGFGTLVHSSEGTLARTSADGTEWDEQSTSGIPPQAFATQLTAGGDQFVAALQEWPSYDEPDEDEVFLEDEAGPELSIATSANLLEWDATVLPSFGADAKYGTSEFLAGLAASDDNVVALISVIENSPNPLRLLLEAGLIDESDLGSFCGFDWEAAESGEPVAVYRCDHEAEEIAHMEFEEAMSAAESDDEREAIEREFEESFVEPEREEIAVIQPGTDLYEEFQLFVQEDEGGRGTTLVMRGPIGGPYTTSELPTDGFPIGLVSVGDGFVTAVNSPTESGTIFLGSPTGSDWAEVGRIEAGGIYQLASGNNVLVASGGDGDGPHVFSSANGGVSWSEAGLTSDLYQAYGLVVAGPAGVAMWIEGATEPYEQFAPPPLVMEKDGYVLFLDFDADQLTLTAPNGEVVREITGFIETSPNDLDGVTETDESAVTFFDLDSGEPLVTYTAEDYEQAYGEAVVEPPDFDPPPFARELHFTDDGQSWRQLEAPGDFDENTYPQLAAVGDDEVLLSTTTWLEPPDELFEFEFDGRDPTDAEIEALDAWFAENDGGAQIEWYRVPLG